MCEPSGLEQVRTHGAPPFKVAVVHGGPGAGGEMAPVARELARARGVLEPIQTATSLKGQVEELRDVLESHGTPPVILIGFSWGAWLSFIVAARHPALVKKLILVSSGPFEGGYAARLRDTRMRRLDQAEREAFNAILSALEDPETGDKDALLARLGALVRKTDVYDPVVARSEEADRIIPRGNIFQRVWREAAQLREGGDLLAFGRQIQCPVVAIHGDYDPHPAAGVREPLAAVLEDFSFVLIEHCGHKPWIERQAQETFFYVLEEEVS